ncbi:MAG: sigma-70 family RNA polymerase sigma factor [candidate division Zixibacteria bacterium]|nr:sigma-70 family RNA polymerase sigma factor [candidate division Zixibacteria bacterium]
MKKQHDSFYKQKENIRREIFCQLRACKILLARLHWLHPDTKKFGSWEELIESLPVNELRSNYSDTIIRAILDTMQKSSNDGWTTVLTAIFWPLLEIIYKKLTFIYQIRDRDLDDLWQNIYLTFLKVINRIKLSERKAPISLKIYNDIYHDIYQTIISNFKRNKTDTSLESLTVDKIDEIFKIKVDPGIVFYENINEYEVCLKHGVIDELDYHILVNTFIRNDTLENVAFDLGIGYEAAKKRRQRAVKKVEDFLKKLSPNHDKHPL